MLTMNRATLVGHAGRNPEMRRMPSGDEVALFSLATTERFRRRDGTEGEATEWHAIVAFGGAAEAVRKLVRRGDPVLVEGRIATRSWTDRKGAEHRTTEIVVSGPRGHVNVLAKRRPEPGGDDEPPGGAASAAAAKAANGDGNEEAADATAPPVPVGIAGDGAGEDAGPTGDVDAAAGVPEGDAAQADGAGGTRSGASEPGTAGDGADGSGDSGAAGPSEDGSASADAESDGTGSDTAASTGAAANMADEASAPAGAGAEPSGADEESEGGNER